MRVAPPGGKPPATVASIRTGREPDQRVPALGSRDFTARLGYLKSVIFPRSGDAKDFEDLGSLALGWVSELFGFTLDHCYFAAVLLKSEAGFSVLASHQKVNAPKIDFEASGLNLENSLAGYVMREGVPVYLPNVLWKNLFPKTAAQTDFAVVRMIKDYELEILPLAQTGMDIALLTEKIGIEYPCFLAAPMAIRDEALGVLLVGIGVADYFHPTQAEELFVVRELAKNLAFSIKMLQKKALNR